MVEEYRWGECATSEPTLEYRRCTHLSEVDCFSVLHAVSKNWSIALIVEVKSISQLNDARLHIAISIRKNFAVLNSPLFSEKVPASDWHLFRPRPYGLSNNAFISTMIPANFVSYVDGGFRWGVILRWKYVFLFFRGNHV